MNLFYSGVSKCECTDKHIIGRIVHIEFGGELKGVEARAKVDTGAYTGGIHVVNVEESDGVLRFRPLDDQHPVVETEHYRTKWVKSSSGDKETRYVVNIPAHVNGVETTLELTLAERSDMKYPILIGRKNLANKLFVDVTL